ncbi:hypothetical protein BH20ACI2_BH20ACI2_04700 [soil metagenome]
MMDVFKDLIDELKEENLLEDTVVEAENASDLKENDQGFRGPLEDLENSRLTDKRQSPDESLSSVLDANNEELALEISEAAMVSKAPDEDVIPSVVKPSNGKEFYKKRAISEMSNLQMVEHVLTGVEREYLKVVPKVFDDFAAKKALNLFLQVSKDENSAQHAEAELAMMEETEAWCIALAIRDRDIPVASIRRYCENSRPALSSQALVSLARFYRNLPYSETVRSKFDFVITRLFSRPTPGNKRVCLFSKEEMLNHISLLYKEWSSVPLYSADDDESKILLTALSFEELANEAENASSFDLLIANDFFGRLTMFKESVSELFFAPNVTASTIDCNIRVGNAYIALIDSERTKMDGQSLFSKFGSIDNLSISDATARTLEIVDILRKQRDLSVSVNEAEQLPQSDGSSPQNQKKHSTDDSHASSGDRVIADSNSGRWDFELKEKVVDNVLSVNRWLLGTAAILIVVSIGIYAWTSISAEPPRPNASVRTIELNDSDLQKHLKTVRISGENFYGSLLPSWDTMPKEKRHEFLRMVFEFAQEKGCSQVNLLDSEGKAAAFASPSKSEVIMN